MQYIHIFIYYIDVHAYVFVYTIYTCKCFCSTVPHNHDLDRQGSKLKKCQESKDEKLNPRITPSSGHDPSFSRSCLQYSGVGTEIDWLQIHQIQ